ncbi:MAG: MATE family efflux transporter [Sedimentisphaerales bacterium]|nr:MATE family efflux transporter [Sedimentisphaerales bacterium]
MENPSTHQTDLLNSESSLAHMLKLSWPIIVTNISFTIMQFVDTRMVAELGTSELAAIQPATLMSFIPASFLLGVIICVSTFVSQSLGKGDTKECSSYSWQVFYMGMLFSLIVTVTMWPLAGWIFRTMNQPKEIIPAEIIYFRIMLYCQFLVVLIWATNQFFIGIHRPVITLVAALAAQATNLVMNYILIFGKFGFPRMEIAGAAWGTFIGLIVGALIRTGWFLSKNVNQQFFTRTNYNIDTSKMIAIIRIGLPAGFSMMIKMTFWTLILFGLVGRFGKEPLAATNAVWSCMRVSFMPVIGLGHALTAAVGKSIGSGKKDLAVKQTHLCLKIAVLYMGMVGLCFYLFRYDIMNFWAKNDDVVIEAGISMLIFAALFQMFDAVLIIHHDALRGAGDTIYLALIEVFTAVLVLGGGGYCMVRFFPQLGANGPWLAGLAKIVCGAIANALRFRGNKWRKIDLFRQAKTGVPAEMGPVTD